jgi:hypothetical protein
VTVMCPQGRIPPAVSLLRIESEICEESPRNHHHGPVVPVSVTIAVTLTCPTKVVAVAKGNPISRRQHQRQPSALLLLSSVESSAYTGRRMRLDTDVGVTVGAVT